MRVLLIAPPLMDHVDGQLVPISMDRYRECPPFGLLLVQAALRETGHEVVVIDLIAQGSPDVSAYRNLFEFAHLVGIGASSLSWPTARDCIVAIHVLRPELPIVLGGIHPTMFDKYVLATTSAHFVIRGEGEVAVRELCEAMEGKRSFQSVGNLTWKDRNGRVQRNPINPCLPPDRIAQCPVPDYSRIPEGVYNGLGIESSRGCPFDCSFCSTSYRRTWRPLPAELFVNRLESVMAYKDRTRSGTIQIVDDEFSIDRRRCIVICRELERRGLSPRLVFDVRANDLLDPTFVEAISPFAFQFLVGAECGYDAGLERVGKRTSCQKLEQAAAALKQAQMADRADFSFILGLPWETKSEVVQTVRFACRLYASYGIRILLQWYCQIPGSRLWEENRKKGIVHPAQYDDYGFFQNLYLFRTGTHLTPEEIHEISDMVQPVAALARLHSSEKQYVEYAHPEPIARYYPPFPDEVNVGTGLASLREVASIPCDDEHGASPPSSEKPKRINKRTSHA